MNAGLGRRLGCNEKNKSQIRCKGNTYNQPYPQIVRARHVKLAVDHNDDVLHQRLDTETSPKIEKMRRSYEPSKMSLT